MERRHDTKPASLFEADNAMLGLPVVAAAPRDLELHEARPARVPPERLLAPARPEDVAVVHPEGPEVLEGQVHHAPAGVLPDVAEDVCQLEGEAQGQGGLDGRAAELAGGVRREPQDGERHDADRARDAVAVHLQLAERLVPALHQVHRHAPDHVLEGARGEAEAPDPLHQGQVAGVAGLPEVEDVEEPPVPGLQVGHRGAPRARAVHELVGGAAPAVDGPDGPLLPGPEELGAEEERP
eukprot:CAMPEP_0179299722 /NCGR_PEP_ID=MMETSP0797-20121207/46664_1 /TAXON_ID=47934 /ORGANISM="Dinophysis acuminata, Strain DAEP01" /LENGTH=238 /DNA_ID=CAMNT_0021009167 /DNA_START=185 /DNA_END=898 /DNA_ORIENTATION=+